MIPGRETGDAETASPIARRSFLVGGAAALGLATLPAAPAIARTKIPGTRRLAFISLHTGEKTDVTYFANGGYVPDALSRLDDLMRDHRNDQARPIDRTVYDQLAKLRDVFDVSDPFLLISGFRSPDTNEWLRRQGRAVAKRSYHLRGQAIDIRVPGADLVDVARAAKAMKRGGVGLYRRSNFVHVDSGPVRSWGI